MIFTTLQNYIGTIYCRVWMLFISLCAFFKRDIPVRIKYCTGEGMTNSVCGILYLCRLYVTDSVPQVYY
jgi:hypothetical protein